VDGSGRLNTPTTAQEYFGAHGIEEFFVTTLDERIGLIYPLSVWMQHIEKMAANPETADGAYRLSVLGNGNGAEVKMDKTGRILLPARLRELIPFGKQPVYLAFYGGVMKLMTTEVRDAEQLAAKSHLADDLGSLRKAGLY
jgi:MraZ protein